MTKKDLFRIIIKLFGLYSLISFVSVYFTQISFIFQSSIGIDPITILYIVGVLIVFILLLGFLIFSPDTIVKWFRLDKGYDDNEVKFELSSLDNLLSMATVIVGGCFILTSFSPIIIDLGDLVREVAQSRSIASTGYGIDNQRLYINILNLAIGYLLITNHRAITRFLLKVNTPKDN